LESMLYCLECMETRHLKQLLKNFISPLVSNCPIHLAPAIIGTVLPKFLITIFNVMNQNWRKIQQSDSHSSEKEEIVEDKLLRDLTREYSGWLLHVLNMDQATSSNHK